MCIIITRPVAITGAGGVRLFAPGLTVELDEAAARQLVQQGSAVVRELPVQDVPAVLASAEPASAPADDERRSAADVSSKPAAPEILWGTHVARKVATAMQHPPDINVRVLLYVEDQVGVALERPEAQAG